MNEPDYRVENGIFYIPADVPVVPIQPGWKRERMYQAIRNTMIPLLRAQGVKIFVHGLENVPVEGPALVATNHIGYYDFIAGALPGMLRGRRPTRYMAKKELFDHWLLGPVCRSVRHIEVDRSLGADSIATAVERLEEGEVVGIFPDGTLSPSFELSDFKTGAARIAQQSGAPLIPVASWGTQRFWTKGRKPNLGRNHYPIVINIGPAISADGTAEEVTQRLKDAMQELLDASRAQYNDRFGPFPPGLDWMPASMGGSAPTLEEARVIKEREKAERDRKKGKK